MNRILFPLLLFAYFLHINSASSRNLQIPKLNNHFDKENDCRYEGFKCLDCYTSQLCQWNEKNSTFDETLNYCSDKQTCSESGVCSTLHQPKCHPDKVNCTQEGNQCFDCYTSQSCVWNEENNNYDEYFDKCSDEQMCSKNGICSSHDEPHCSFNKTACRYEGFKCLDCYTSQLCQWNEKNSVFDEILSHCSDGQTCSESGVCSTLHQPKCHPDKVNCTQEGNQCFDCYTSQTCVWNEENNNYDEYFHKCSDYEMCSKNGFCSRHEEPHCSFNETACRYEGFKCLDCYTSQLCQWNEKNGNFDEILNYCSDGQTCSESGVCSTLHQPKCHPNKTNCTQEGNQCFDCYTSQSCVWNEENNNYDEYFNKCFDDEMCSKSGICSSHEEPHCSSNNTTCTSEGHKCLDCYTSQECVWNEGNSTFNEYLHYCYDGQTCSASNGTCTYYHDPQCLNNTTNPGEFKCQTPGMYPDPFDCKQYYYCVPGNETTNYTLITYAAKCECDFGYNPLTKDCDIKLNNSQCAFPPVSRCYSKGQNGALWQNPRIYYICIYNSITRDDYPYLYSCEHGKVYNPSIYLCQ